MISGENPLQAGRYSNSQHLGLPCSATLFPPYAMPSAPCKVLSLGTPAASCYQAVCNSNVVWFPLCCKGPKSPALPRPDAAAGECHKA